MGKIFVSQIHKTLSTVPGTNKQLPVNSSDLGVYKYLMIYTKFMSDIDYICSKIN